MGMLIMGVNSENYSKSSTQNHWTRNAGTNMKISELVQNLLPDQLNEKIHKDAFSRLFSRFNFPMKRSFSSIRIRNDGVSKLDNAYKILEILRKIVESSKEEQIL